MDQSGFLENEIAQSWSALLHLLVLREQLAKIETLLDRDADLSLVNETQGIRATKERSQPFSDIVGPPVGQAQIEIQAIENAVQSIAQKTNEFWEPMPLQDEAQNHNGRLERSCLGNVTIRHSRRRFLRGYVDLVEQRVIASHLPEGVIALFRSVPGTGDLIVREKHGHWGYHYHYLDQRKRRSDTLLTFDQRTSADPEPKLCWERHAEGGKFPARAGTWGKTKRRSVYGVCYPDTKNWPLTVFKTPSHDALSVWPT